MRCLHCYQTLENGEIDFHISCSKKFFGQATVPEINLDENKLEELGVEIIKKHIAVTGVQPKLSLNLNSESKQLPKRFTIVGLWGEYILKPASNYYPQLPEVEDLTMHLAKIARISVVPHSLIRLQSGRLAYITKRIDRVKFRKLHMEDMCQLTMRLTEDKYHGSYEQVAKTILKYSNTPGLDVVNFFEQVLFSFLTGNADMHLKNYSLIYHSINGPQLSPAYDLVATAIVNPGDLEELALTLNGKKRKLKRSDFEAAFGKLELDKKQIENIFIKMEKAYSKWLDFIAISFLSEDFKQAYNTLLGERFARLKN